MLLAMTGGDGWFAMTSWGMTDSQPHNYSHFARAPFRDPRFLFVESAGGVFAGRTISHFCLSLQIYPSNLQQYDMLRIDK